MNMARKTGIILMNLGSPDSTEVKDVRRYLNEFLMDGKVIDYPYVFRALLVRGIIVPFRAPKSAEAYRTIWTKEGSPLLVISRQLRDAVQAQVEVPVVIAMRYGNPTPEAAFEELIRREPGLEQVFAIPLYPHYAMSSYETAVEHVRETHHRKGYKFSLVFKQPYFDDPGYISALADSMRPYLLEPHDHILFSYHGVPKRHIRKSDPTGSHCLGTGACCSTASPAHATCYRHQVMETTRLVTAALSIPKERYSVSFQSRLGKGWLEPFTDKRLEELPGEGVKKLLVVCPAFVSDCLETLEEIAERGMESFIKAGGTAYTAIPCMNTQETWVSTLSGWIHSFAAGKPVTREARDR
jgi:protoporphyrin/coproporphyrin ferrochelatase